MQLCCAIHSNHFLAQQAEWSQERFLTCLDQLVRQDAACSGPESSHDVPIAMLFSNIAQPKIKHFPVLRQLKPWAALLEVILQLESPARCVCLWGRETSENLAQIPSFAMCKHVEEDAGQRCWIVRMMHVGLPAPMTWFWFSLFLCCMCTKISRGNQLKVCQGVNQELLSLVKSARS